MNLRCAPTPACTRCRRGVTIIDLTLTMFIIGIFAAIAMPRYGQLVSTYQLEAAARRLAADLQFARHRAKLEGAPCSVQFDTAAHRYELVGVADPDHVDRPYIVSPANDGGGVTFAAVVLGPSGAETAITFDLYGRPDAGGEVTLRLDGRERTVRIDEHTGVAAVQL